MVYKTTYQGITIYSNVPPNEPQPSGSYYQITLTFNNSIASILANSGIDIMAKLDPQAIASAFAGQGHPVSNVQVKQNGNNVIITFVASSPPVLVAIAIILALIVIALAFIYSITVNVSKSPSLSFLSVALGIGIIAGVGLIMYGFVKDEETRNNLIEASRNASKVIRRGSEYISNYIT